MAKHTSESIKSAHALLANVIPSHNEPHKIREGWQFGMFEKEITNYRNGNGPVMRVYADTSEEAEAIALVVCRKLSKGLDTELEGYYRGLLHTTEQG